MITKLSSKGQVVLPKSIRRALGLDCGARLHIEVAGNRIILEPISMSVVDRLHGKFKGVNFLEALEEDHRRELVRDEAANCS